MKYIILLVLFVGCSFPTKNKNQCQDCQVNYKVCKKCKDYCKPGADKCCCLHWDKCTCENPTRGK